MNYSITLSEITGKFKNLNNTEFELINAKQVSYNWTETKWLEGLVKINGDLFEVSVKLGKSFHQGLNAEIKSTVDGRTKFQAFVNA